MKRVTDYEIIDHGVDHPQYFEGCGTAFTEFDEAFTGAGDTAREALEDALEQVYMGEAYVPDSIEKAFDAAKKELSNDSVIEALIEEREHEYCQTVDNEANSVKFFSIGESYTCPECIQASGIGDEFDTDGRIDELMDSGLSFEQADKQTDAEFKAFCEEKWSKGEFIVEGAFSWRSCDLCNSSLGGNRYPAHGIADDGSILHYDVCEDCVQYVANGETPDFSHELENNELYYYASIRVKVEE